MALSNTFASRIASASSGYHYNNEGRLTQTNFGGDQSAVQRVSYNNWEFPSALKSSAEFSPVMSDNGRTRIGTKVTLKIDTVIVDQTNSASQLAGIDQVTPSSIDARPTTDAEMNSLRAALCAPGKPLIIDLQGVGLIRIVSQFSHANTDAGYYLDIDQGPKPEMVSWEPITPHAARVNWTVTAVIPDCDLGSSQVLRDFSCSVTTAIDKSGHTTRTITGKFSVINPFNKQGIETAQYELQNRQIIETEFPALVNFQREISMTLSPDGATCEFTITDTQFKSESPFFPGVADMDVDLTIRSNRDLGLFTQWPTTLSGTIELMDETPKSVAFLAILTLIDHYIALAFTGTAPKGDSTNYDPPDDSSFAILEDLEFTDSLYSNTVSFSATWRMIVNWDSVIASSGLFVPANVAEFGPITYEDGDTETGVLSTDPLSFPRWRASANRVQTSLGGAGLIFNQRHMPSIVLCQGGEDNPDRSQPTKSYTQPSVNYSPLNGIDRLKSYIGGQIEVEHETEEKTFMSSPLDDSDSVRESRSAYNGSSAQTPFNNRLLDDPEQPTAKIVHSTDSASAGTSSVARVFARKTGRTGYYVTVRGVLMRYGYHPIIPDAATIGGAQIRKVGNDKIVYKTIGQGIARANNKSVPLIAAVFSKRYFVSTSDAPTHTRVQDINKTEILDSTITS